MIWTLLFGALPLAIWIYLVAARGMFWRLRERDDRDLPTEPGTWPSVVAVVPARDEADVIARSVGDLLAQDYPGAFRVVVVDDGSSDGTAQTAREAAAALGKEDSLEVLSGASLPAGWTGKLWAVKQGVERAALGQPDYLLLTDADIGHAPDNLRTLAARAQAGGVVLTSQMVRLHCQTAAERFLIPAFVYFFDMLYPFAWVNNPRRRTAAAAGGCMLVRRDALQRAGGVAAIRNALIDDCTLGALMKRQGPVWLGLTRRAWSLRPYRTTGDVGRMISRSAYAQLRYSPLLLAGTLAGMGLTYIAPPAAAILGHGALQLLGAAAWLLMALSFIPISRFYGRAPWWGVALPAIGATYGWFTVMSAVQVWRGRGGMWKGRAQALAGEA
jgi:hopene-associated glycosyltransferase HpnB